MPITANIRSPRSFGLITGALALLLAGCASSEPEVVALETRSGAPLLTGQYPNLNIPLNAAAPQFTDAERDAKIASLRSAGARATRGVGAPAPSNAELIRLGQNRGEDVLKEIEAD